MTGGAIRRFYRQARGVPSHPARVSRADRGNVPPDVFAFACAWHSSLRSRAPFSLYDKDATAIAGCQGCDCLRRRCGHSLCRFHRIRERAALLGTSRELVRVPWPCARASRPAVVSFCRWSSSWLAVCRAPSPSIPRGFTDCHDIVPRLSVEPDCYSVQSLPLIIPGTSLSCTYAEYNAGSATRMLGYVTAEEQYGHRADTVHPCRQYVGQRDDHTQQSSMR